MSRRKVAADEISKMFYAHEEEDSSSSESESHEDVQLDYQPSRLRDDAVPDYGGHKVTRAELEEESSDESSSEEYDSDDLVVPEPDEVKDLEQELAELEEGEGPNIIDSLRQQQEADLKVAHGTSALQNEYKRLLALRLKMQSILCDANALPPEGDPFIAASHDPDVAALCESITQGLRELEQRLHAMKLEQERVYGWTGTDNPDEPSVGEGMMEIIQHWGLRLRLGTTHGSVINRPIETQIAAALEDKPTLVQPSRHRENTVVFGLDEQPEVCSGVYNDNSWYKRLLADYLSEKKPDAKFVVERPKQKHVLKGRQINYDVIPELQGFMIPSKPCIVSDDVDVLYNSLMK